MERMTKKMRRAEIEERMDAGYSYEAAGACYPCGRALRLAFHFIFIPNRLFTWLDEDCAVKEVDQLMKARAAELAVADVEEQELADSLKELFVAVDRDRFEHFVRTQIRTSCLRLAR